MSILLIILVIITGLILLILEILFVPGMILGIISALLMIIGIYSAFNNHGRTIGWIVLGSTIFLTIAAVYYAFYSGIWKKLQVQSTIDGKSNVVEEGKIKIGDSGTTISRLNPVGKAFINNIQIEVQAHEGFIDEAKDITVVRKEHNKIIVRLKK